MDYSEAKSATPTSRMDSSRAQHREALLRFLQTELTRKSDVEARKAEKEAEEARLLAAKIERDKARAERVQEKLALYQQRQENRDKKQIEYQEKMQNFVDDVKVKQERAVKMIAQKQNQVLNEAQREKMLSAREKRIQKAQSQRERRLHLRDEHYRKEQDVAERLAEIMDSKLANVDSKRAVYVAKAQSVKEKAVTTHAEKERKFKEAAVRLENRRDKMRELLDEKVTQLKETRKEKEDRVAENREAQRLREVESRATSPHPTEIVAKALRNRDDHLLDATQRYHLSTTIMEELVQQNQTRLARAQQLERDQALAKLKAKTQRCQSAQDQRNQHFEQKWAANWDVLVTRQHDTQLMEAVRTCDSPKKLNKILKENNLPTIGKPKVQTGEDDEKRPMTAR
mmetsp:Transcript_72694/g.166788  ORF Transcript_72694/g.166788 Transcript_72694/m.166788 type:complete len:399 (+) Transcript_72694:685-1881(+)